MKRSGLLALLLALCLALPLFAGAQAALRDEGGQALNASSLCLQGDRLLVLSGRALYGWRPGEAAPALLAQLPEGFALHQLISDGERLYGLDVVDWRLSPLTLAGGQLRAGAALGLRSDTLEDPLNRGLAPLTALILEDSLYLLLSPGGLGGWEQEVHAFDLSSGQGRKLALPHPQWLAAGPEGSLLLLSHDYRAASNNADPADDYPSVLTVDPVSLDIMARTALARPFDQGLTLPMAFWASGALHYTTQDALYLRDAQGQERLVARLPGLDSDVGGGQPLIMMTDGTLALLSRGQALTLSPEAQARGAADSPLQVYGLHDLARHEQVLAALPGQAARLVEALDATALGQLLASGGGIDVLFLRSGQDEVSRLIDKGYLMDLSGSEAVREHLARCYPLVADSARRSEGLYLLPVALDSTLYTYRPALFETLGLAVPETFGELADFLQTWADEGLERWPDYLPLTTGQPRRELLAEAAREAFLQQALRGEAYRFDDPLARDLLSRALALDLGPLELPEGDYSFMNKPALIGRTNLSLGSLSVSAGFGPGEKTLPLPIKPAADLPAALPVELSYLAVYAGSAQPDKALHYLESWLATLDHESRVKLYPDFNEPLQLGGIDAIVARYDAQIQQLGGQIAAAQGAEKTELERQREETLRVRDEQESMRWHLSPDIIARYRDLMRRAVIATRELNILWNEPDFRGLLDRLGQGQLSLDAFIGEAQGKLRLMQLEAQ